MTYPLRAHQPDRDLHHALHHLVRQRGIQNRESVLSGSGAWGVVKSQECGHAKEEKERVPGRKVSQCARQEAVRVSQN